MAHRLSTVRDVRTRTGEDEGCVDRIRSVYSCDICCRGRYMVSVDVPFGVYGAVVAVLELNRALGSPALQKVVYRGR